MASNIQDSNSGLGSFAECEICTEKYNIEIASNKPYVLQCGHTFCKQCLDHVSECPSCRQPFRDKKPNFFAITLLEKEANERHRANLMTRFSTNLEETKRNFEQADRSRSINLK